MKKLIILSFVALMFATQGCKKEYPASMTAKIKGVDKNFIFRLSFRGGVENVFEGFLIRATTGIDLSNGDYLTLLIRGVEQKSYDFQVSLSGDVRLQCEAIYRPKSNNDTSLVYIGKTGTITITKVDDKNKLVSGTFEFTMVNKKDANDLITISNGKFENLKYSKTSLPTDDFSL